MAVSHRDRPRGGERLSKITVSKDDPCLVSGNLPLSKVTIGTNAEGEFVR
jgi:hypothetical protein